ncbi:unnamed protein product, partial [Discosporangium mesarthrocarpum]
RGQSYNVVLTHIVADFDSLAAAVGVAKLWQLQHPETPAYVVLPSGAHPSVANFLSLHLELFPIRGLGVLDPAGAKMVGVCDAQTRDRVGPALEILDSAEEVHVYDHHVEKDSDLQNATVVIDNVGAVTTMITELLQKEHGQAMMEVGGSSILTEAEATLLALGIHADTGKFWKI